MILNNLKSPFDKVLDNPTLSRFEKGHELVRIYNIEKKKALKLADGGYSIKKINYLQTLLAEAQKQIARWHDTKFS